MTNSTLDFATQRLLGSLMPNDGSGYLTTATDVSPATASDPLLPAHALTAIVGGYGAAAGANPITVGTIDGQSVDQGLVAVATGTAQFQASAQVLDGMQPVVAAGTFANFAGADFIFETIVNTYGVNGDTATATSTIKYIAIDIAGWSPANGPIEIDNVINITTGRPSLGHSASAGNQSHGHGHHGCHERAEGPAPSHHHHDGSHGSVQHGAALAGVAATASALGPDSLALTNTSSLTLDNVFSLVNGYALTTIG